LKQESAPPKIIEYHLRTSNRRTLKHAIIFFGIAAVAVVCLPLTSHYFRFKHKPSRYFAEFGSACDSVLINYPLGTNRSVAVSPGDLRLPKIISDLHPLMIEVSSHRVWVFVNGSHVNGLAIIWEPVWDPTDVGQTNRWILSITNGEGADADVYVTNRVLASARP
jgi:hypothetical protein